MAGFLGSPSINFIRAKVTGENELQLAEGQKITIPAARLNSGRNLKEVDIGIRPEYISVVQNTDTPPSGTINWEASVSLAQSLGSEILVYVQLADRDITLRITENKDFPEGSKLKLGFDIERAHIFSANDGTLLSSGSKT